MSCNCHNVTCNDCNPCAPDPCIPVPQSCYQDCGCLNPTTWSCLTHPGIHSTLGILDTMNGEEVLTSIATVIDNLVIGIPPSGDDKFAKISSTDTIADYLNNKLLVQSPIVKTVINVGANEKIRFGLSIPALKSSDTDNLIQIGTDGKLRVLASSTPADIKVAAGTGVTVTGTGPATDPYVVSINPSISVVRPCFDSIWRNMTLAASGNTSVIYVGGNPQYRYRYDGTIEFRGSITYTVNFGAYTTGTRKYTIPMGSIPTTCLTAGEQTGISDLKGINYINPNGVGDQITQEHGYIIRKNAQNYILEFQSSFIAATSKTVVVNFEGVQVHPNI